MLSILFYLSFLGIMTTFLWYAKNHWPTSDHILVQSVPWIVFIACLSLLVVLGVIFL